MLYITVRTLSNHVGNCFACWFMVLKESRHFAFFFSKKKNYFLEIAVSLRKFVVTLLLFGHELDNTVTTLQSFTTGANEKKLFVC